MGGLRVTGRFTLEEVPLIDEANLRWAVAHGVLAQIILGATATLWLLRSPSWQRSGSGRRAVRSFRFSCGRWCHATDFGGRVPPLPISG